MRGDRKFSSGGGGQLDAAGSYLDGAAISPLGEVVSGAWPMARQTHAAYSLYEAASERRRRITGEPSFVPLSAVGSEFDGVGEFVSYVRRSRLGFCFPFSWCDTFFLC